MGALRSRYYTHPIGTIYPQLHKEPLRKRVLNALISLQTKQNYNFIKITLYLELKRLFHLIEQQSRFLSFGLCLGDYVVSSTLS